MLPFYVPKLRYITGWDERALKKKICMWPGQRLVPVSVSRVQERAGDVLIRSNARGFHCSTPTGCGCGWPQVDVRKLYRRVAPKNTMTAWMLLTVTLDARLWCGFVMWHADGISPNERPPSEKKRQKLVFGVW